MHEAIVCAPAEFVMLTTKRVARALVQENGTLPDWLSSAVSIQDWWKGYRQLFPSQERAGLAVVAVFDPS